MEHVKRAFRSLESTSVAILGEDVYEQRVGRVDAMFDNEYCEQQADESFAIYVRRPWEHTHHYILSYSQEPRRSLYFVLVLYDEARAGL